MATLTVVPVVLAILHYRFDLIQHGTRDDHDDLINGLPSEDLRQILKCPDANFAVAKFLADHDRIFINHTHHF